ncbi:MAG: glycine cleavage system protein GcvH [Candidatus Omnitrophica bacterium]|nr:glycine cleavage system protein GcvH [Candidatus Omnitrophota bacterium]
MNIPADLRYTKSHEWARREADQKSVVVGITEHAQEELKDVVFVELPPVGKAVKAGEAVAVVESVKAAFDIYAPVSGTIAAVNTQLERQPQLVNQDSYGQGWFFKITPSQSKEWEQLMSSGDYTKALQVST